MQSVYYNFHLNLNLHLHLFQLLSVYLDCPFTCSGFTINLNVIVDLNILAFIYLFFMKKSFFILHNSHLEAAQHSHDAEFGYYCATLPK